MDLLEIVNVSVAVIALVLTQLKPIKDWFKKAELELNVTNKIWLTHQIGNPIIDMPLYIKNIGGKEVSILKSDLNVYRYKSPDEPTFVATLPGTIYQDQTKPNTPWIFFRRFSLEPAKEWAYTMRFANSFGIENEKKYKKNERGLRKKIDELRHESQNENKLIEVDDSDVKEFQDMFNDLFIWSPGAYRIELNIETLDNISDIKQNYEFTIYEYISDDFKEDKNRFKTGDRVYWNSDNYFSASIEIKEA